VERRPIPGIVATLHTPGDVRVLDLCVYGMSLEAAADVEVGGTFCLEMRHGVHRANVEVAVRWRSVSRMERRRGRLLPVSRVGVEFLEVLRDPPGGIWDWACRLQRGAGRAEPTLTPARRSAIVR
jgi:hypothetical protein